MSVDRLRFAVIPTRNRPEDYARAHEAIRAQVDHVITLCHGVEALRYANGIKLLQPETPLNISTWWKEGIAHARMLAGSLDAPFDVAVINDDAIVPPGWFDRLAEAMHAAGAAGASGPRQDDKPATMAGYAFILNGDKRIQPDEAMRWWGSDDAIEHRCIKAGGMVIVHADPVPNLRANVNYQTNPTLREWWKADAATFRATYGEFIGPWNTHRGGPVPFVISAPSGEIPTHLLEGAGNRPILILATEAWEDDHLRIAATAYDWFVFLKESTRLVDPAAFWAAVDARTEPAWLFAPPSCFMGLFERTSLLAALKRIRITSKWGSVHAEGALHESLDLDVLWPEVTDENALRLEDGELVIGNRIIEKLKGSAWCGGCEYDPPGICEHVMAGVA